jgi:hypothetical protein
MTTSATSKVSAGAGRFRYHALAQWEQLPAGWSFIEVAGW